MSQRSFSQLLAGAIVVAATALVSPATAATRTFKIADCNSGLSCSPQLGNNFGTITIKDNGADIVDVNVDLNGATVFWQAGGGNSPIAFAWTLNFSSPVPQVSNMT